MSHLTVGMHFAIMGSERRHSDFWVKSMCVFTTLLLGILSLLCLAVPQVYGIEKLFDFTPL